MSLESKSKELKNLVSIYKEDWFLGDLWFTIHSGRERSLDQLENLSSPQRQLTYLAGLNISTDSKNGSEIMFDNEKWKKIVKLLNEIEQEYLKLLIPNIKDKDENLMKKIQVALPSFLAYFNQGHLNYEEQMINWIKDLYMPLNSFIEKSLGIKVEEFIEFYDIVDKLVQNNYQAHTTNPKVLRDNWQNYTNIKIGVNDYVPKFMKEYEEGIRHLGYFMADNGIVMRFKPEDLISKNLNFEKINNILKLLSCKREERNFIYYTELEPGNPLYTTPIVDIGSNIFQIFDVKQILHAINNLLEKICKKTDKYTNNKGKLLEKKIIDLFNKLFKNNCKIFTKYFVDGFEQDVLILWKNYALIVESKAYLLREPQRNPESAYPRIRDDFKSSIGYAYKQTKRVENKFINKEILEIKNKKGEIIDNIKTENYQDFSIIVNIDSFGQIQCDLSYLLEINNDEIFPWAVKFDDLEIFILTLIAQNKNPKKFIEYLLFRENLHSKLICSDELEICGGFLTKKLNQKLIDKSEIIITTPELGNIFDLQYRKTMGFENEKYLYEKQSGKFHFW